MKFKIPYFDVIAIVSSLVMIAWLISDYYGGMIIYLIMYSFIILPFFVLYIFSFIETIVSVFRKGIRASLVKIYSHSLLIVIIIGSIVFNSELLKSNILIKAKIVGDLNSAELFFRESGRVDYIQYGMFGYTKKSCGEYYIKDSLIIFTNNPSKTDYLKDTLLINGDKIFIRRDPQGNFEKEIDFMNHFAIE